MPTTLPAFAWSVIGPMVQNNPNDAVQRNAGFNVTVTRFANLVTATPPAAECAVSYSGNTSTITWTAVPYDYSYSVWAATVVDGPYTKIASGLTFTSALGSYTDTNAGGSQKFYRVTTP